MAPSKTSTAASGGVEGVVALAEGGEEELLSIKWPFRERLQIVAARREIREEEEPAVPLKEGEERVQLVFCWQCIGSSSLMARFNLNCSKLEAPCNTSVCQAAAEVSVGGGG